VSTTNGGPVALYYCYGATGAVTVNVTMSAATSNLQAYISEWKYVAAGNALDGGHACTGTTGAITCATTALAQTNGEVVYSNLGGFAGTTAQTSIFDATEGYQISGTASTCSACTVTNTYSGSPTYWTEAVVGLKRQQ
jgi:hypothetical protein